MQVTACPNPVWCSAGGGRGGLAVLYESHSMRVPFVLTRFVLALPSPPLALHSTHRSFVSFSPRSRDQPWPAYVINARRALSQNQRETRLLPRARTVQQNPGADNLPRASRARLAATTTTTHLYIYIQISNSSAHKHHITATLTPTACAIILSDSSHVRVYPMTSYLNLSFIVRGHRTKIASLRKSLPVLGSQALRTSNN